MNYSLSFISAMVAAQFDNQLQDVQLKTEFLSYHQKK